MNVEHVKVMKDLIHCTLLSIHWTPGQSQEIMRFYNIHLHVSSFSSFICKYTVNVEYWLHSSYNSLHLIIISSSLTAQIENRKTQLPSMSNKMATVSHNVHQLFPRLVGNRPFQRAQPFWDNDLCVQKLYWYRSVGPLTTRRFYFALQSLKYVLW